MCIQFKIRVTKEILKQSKNCGTKGDSFEMGRNCALAVALRDIFPGVYVTNDVVFPFGIDNNEQSALQIALPAIAQQFIKLFDGFRLTPNLRLLLPEFEFTIDIPAEVIDAINIDDAKELLSNNKKAGMVSVYSL